MFVRSARNYLPWTWLFAAVVLLPLASVRGDESVLESSAARFLPADGAFYVSCQRNRQQVEAFLNSNAYQHLQQIGFVRKMIDEIKQEGPFQQFQMMRQNPAIGQAIQLVLDGLSNEIFFYGGQEYADVTGSLQELGMVMNTAQIQALFTGGNPERAQLKALMGFLKNLPDEANIPPTIIGFRVSQPQALAPMLDQLSQTAMGLSQQQPMFQGRVHRKKIGNGDYVYIDLDGSMIPWGDIQDEFPGSDEDFNSLKSRLEKKTVSVAIGVYDNFVLLYFGANTDHLAKLGGSQSMASRPEFAKVKEVDDKPVTQLNFVNGDYLKKIADPKKQSQQLAGFVKTALESAPIDDDLRAELKRDLQKLLAKFEESLPKPGSSLYYCYLDGSGYTSASYNWGSMNLDASKPLDVLNHVGGNPLGFFAMRPEYDSSDYDTFAQIVERLIYYGDRIADSQLEGKEKELYTDLRDAIVPLLERLDKANREYLIPAYKGVDGAFVLDGKTSSKSWHAFMPPAEQPLPMIEFGIVDRINDAGKLKEGFGEYFAVAQEMLDKLHDISGKYPDLFPSPIPQITIPQPQTREIADGTVYYYALPPQAALDPQIAPNAGINDRVVAVSLIPKFTKRLMEKKSLSGEMAEFAGKKAGAAYYFNFAGFVDMLMPWADYAAMFLGQTNISTGAGQANDLMTQIKDTATFLKCFKSCRGITTKEGGVWVTRGKVLIQDLPGN